MIKHDPDDRLLTAAKLVIDNLFQAYHPDAIPTPLIPATTACQQARDDFSGLLTRLARTRNARVDVFDSNRSSGVVALGRALNQLMERRASELAEAPAMLEARATLARTTNELADAISRYAESAGPV